MRVPRCPALIARGRPAAALLSSSPLPICTDVLGTWSGPPAPEAAAAKAAAAGGDGEAAGQAADKQRREDIKGLQLRTAKELFGEVEIMARTDMGAVRRANFANARRQKKNADRQDAARGGGTSSATAGGSAAGNTSEVEQIEAPIVADATTGSGTKKKPPRYKEHGTTDEAKNRERLAKFRARGELPTKRYEYGGVPRAHHGRKLIWRSPPGWERKAQAARARLEGASIAAERDLLLTFTLFGPAPVKGAPRPLRDVTILPSTPLELLRAALHCPTDDLIANALAEPAANRVAQLTKADAESAYFLIGETLFDDGDSVAAHQAAWLAAREPTRRVRRRPLSGSTLAGMTLRPGADYVFCHAGCVHPLVLSDVRLANSADPKTVTDYPNVVRRRVPTCHSCDACSKVEATLMVRPAGEDVSRLCNVCFSMLYRDAPGGKLVYLPDDAEVTPFSAFCAAIGTERLFVGQNPRKLAAGQLDWM